MSVYIYIYIYKRAARAAAGSCGCTPPNIIYVCIICLFIQLLPLQ